MYDSFCCRLLGCEILRLIFTVRRYASAVKWKTNRKSYMAYQMAQTPVT